MSALLGRRIRSTSPSSSSSSSLLLWSGSTRRRPSELSLPNSHPDNKREEAKNDAIQTKSPQQQLQKMQTKNRTSVVRGTKTQPPTQPPLLQPNLWIIFLVVVTFQVLISSLFLVVLQPKDYYYYYPKQQPPAHRPLTRKSALLQEFLVQWNKNKSKETKHNKNANNNSSRNYQTPPNINNNNNDNNNVPYHPLLPSRNHKMHHPRSSEIDWLLSPSSHSSTTSTTLDNHTTTAADVQALIPNLIREYQNIVTESMDLQTASWFRYLASYRVPDKDNAKANEGSVVGVLPNTTTTTTIGSAQPERQLLDDNDNNNNTLGLLKKWDDEDDIPRYFHRLNVACRDLASPEFGHDCFLFLQSLVQQPRCTVRMDSRTTCRRRQQKRRRRRRRRHGRNTELHSQDNTDDDDNEEEENEKEKDKEEESPAIRKKPMSSILGPDHWAHNTLNIGIIGAGPVGLYLANALMQLPQLLKQRLEEQQRQEERLQQRTKGKRGGRQQQHARRRRRRRRRRGKQRRRLQNAKDDDDDDSDDDSTEENEDTDDDNNNNNNNNNTEEEEEEEEEADEGEEGHREEKDAAEDDHKEENETDSTISSRSMTITFPEIRVVVFENRVLAEGHKKPYSRLWMTGITIGREPIKNDNNNNNQDDDDDNNNNNNNDDNNNDDGRVRMGRGLDPRILKLFDALMEPGEGVSLPINVWETLLLLSCRDLGVKFIYSRRNFNDYQPYLRQVPNLLMFDATGHRLQPLQRGGGGGTGKGGQEGPQQQDNKQNDPKELVSSTRSSANNAASSVYTWTGGMDSDLHERVVRQWRFPPPWLDSTLASAAVAAASGNNNGSDKDNHESTSTKQLEIALEHTKAGPLLYPVLPNHEPYFTYRFDLSNVKYDPPALNLLERIVASDVQNFSEQNDGVKPPYQGSPVVDYNNDVAFKAPVLQHIQNSTQFLGIETTGYSIKPTKEQGEFLEALMRRHLQPGESVLPWSRVSPEEYRGQAVLQTNQVEELLELATRMSQTYDVPGEQPGGVTASFYRSKPFMYQDPVVPGGLDLGLAKNNDDKDSDGRRATAGVPLLRIGNALFSGDTDISSGLQPQLHMIRKLQCRILNLYLLSRNNDKNEAKDHHRLDCSRVY